MAWNPEVTVAAIVERDNRFLMVEERISGRLVLNQPAGHLEDGETLVEAVIRETREETAWRFRPDALVGTYLWRSPVDGRSFLRFAFCGTVDDHHAQQPLDEGILRALWMTHEQLLAQPSRLALADGACVVCRTTCSANARRSIRSPVLASNRRCKWTL